MNVIIFVYKRNYNELLSRMKLISRMSDRYCSNVTRHQKVNSGGNVIASLQNKINLLRGILHGEKTFNGPFFVDIDVTSRCNMNCLGCQYHSSESRGPSAGKEKTGDISKELVQRLGEELKEIGTREIIITGEGEPFLHPQLTEIIASLKALDFNIQLFTNGTLIDEEIAASILDSGVDILKVSLWASNLEEYSKMYPGNNPKLFPKTMEGIRIVTRLKSDRKNNSTQVILTGPVNHFNYMTLDKKIDLAVQLDCDGIALNPYKHWGGEFQEAALPDSKIAWVIKNLKRHKQRLQSLNLSHNLDDLIHQYHLGENAWVTMPCYAGWFTSRIRSDGTVMPCCRCYIPLGNLNERSFKDIWTGPEYRDFRRTVTQKGGLASLSEACACHLCMFSTNNFRTNSLSSPFLRLLGRGMK